MVGPRPTEVTVQEPLEDLLVELLAWIGSEPRPYGECLEAWRTSCPRLPVWEEATERGFLRRERSSDGEPVAVVTRLGHEHLAAQGSDATAPAATRASARSA